jgi:hypothetical protein
VRGTANWKHLPLRSLLELERSTPLMTRMRLSSGSGLSILPLEEHHIEEEQGISTGTGGKNYPSWTIRLT